MSLLETLPIVDVDSHVVEPRDLWTARMSAKDADLIPQVVWDEGADEHRWKIGNVLLTAETEYATAGWTEHFPAHPPTLEDADPACFDPVARLKALDATGVFAQVLYPNLIGFDSHSFLAELGPALATEAVRAYNDFLDDFASTDRNRLVPIAMLPYWDIDATLAELKRVSDLGFNGVLMAALLSRLGERNLSNPYWNPVLAAIQDLDMSINLHIGFNQQPRDTAEKNYKRRTKTALAQRTNRLSFVKQMAMSSGSVIEATADLILQGTFERFPRLRLRPVHAGQLGLALAYVLGRPRVSSAGVAEHVLAAKFSFDLLVRALESEIVGRLPGQRHVRDRLPARDGRVSRPLGPQQHGARRGDP
jgi:predicted TIM-barrel fold metal-dependent hydrolase